MTRFRRACLSFAVSFAAAGTVPQAHGATFTVLPKTGNIAMTGEIKEGDADRLTNAIVQASNKGMSTKAMWLHSPGGELNAGRELAELVHTLEIQVGVAAGDMCVSACVLVFAAGDSRVVYSTSRLAVHSAGDIDANNAKKLVESPAARAVTVLLARRMSEYGTPASVVAKLITTPPTKVEWLTEEDMQAWDVEVRR